MFNVTKEGKVFVVRGVIAVIAGRIVNEEYARGFRTAKEAERNARDMNDANICGLSDYNIVRACRVITVREYCAARALRANTAQLGFAF